MPKSTLIINVLLFQLGWFACVALGASTLHWLGSVVVMFVIAVHVYQANKPAEELMLIASAMFIGLVWDSFLVASHLLVYQYGLLSEALAPHWIIAMWALFATTINVSLKWLKGKWLLAALFGAIGGPLSFYAGLKLGAVTMPDFTNAMLTLAVGWAIFMPLLVLLAERFNGFAIEPSAIPANKKEELT